MDTGNSLRFFRRLMLVLNFMICGYLLYIYVGTPCRAVQQSAGLRFAQELNALPEEPWKLFGIPLGLCILLLVSACYRRKESFYAALWLEPLLCLLITFGLHLDYNGLLLLAIVDLVDGLRGRRRVLFLGGMASLYLLTSMDILPPRMNMVTVAEYLTFYGTHSRQFLQNMLSLFSALNLILFLIYMVLLVGQRTEENDAAARLNRELEQANGKLVLLNERLKAYAAESERMAETRERNRLAREIHDTLGHTLTGITAGADACIEMLEISPEMAKKQMERIAAAARQGMNEVRRSVSALRPDALERLQLPEALRQLCEEMQQTSRASVRLRLETQELRLSADEEDAVYRIVQESVTNAIRHGQASEVWVSIAPIDRGLTIIVQDNGIGCKTPKPGFGLRHMAERLRLLGGTLRTDGTNGFRIEANLPLRWGDSV